MPLITILYLYLSFRAKHFLCDFLLQTQWMVMTKGENGPIGYKALAIHSAIHAFGTLIICMIFAPSFWWLAILDFFLHGIIDKTKSRITKSFNWNENDSKFWWAFGLDQELHNLSHLAYIVLIVINT